MPAFKLHFKTNFQSEATFEGAIEPNGSTGYKFSGTLTAHCRLNRAGESFSNTVRLGHGGNSDEFTYEEFTLEGGGDNTFTVEGKGRRASNEEVDFRLGFNEGLSGQYDYCDKITVEAGGPWQTLRPVYITENGYYDVRLEAKARADGPTGYVLEGELSAEARAGTLTTQRATLGYKTSSGSWEYKTYDCESTPESFKVVGSRKAGEKIRVIVGATSGIANIYGYGDEVSTELPEKF